MELGFVPCKTVSLSFVSVKSNEDGFVVQGESWIRCLRPDFWLSHWDFYSRDSYRKVVVELGLAWTLFLQLIPDPSQKYLDLPLSIWDWQWWHHWKGLHLIQGFKNWKNENRCWWRMLETKKVGDNFRMTVTIFRCWWQIWPFLSTLS